VAVPVEDGCGPEAKDRDDDRRRQPYSMRTRPAEALDEGEQRLVPLPRDVAGIAALQEQPVQPPARGIRGRDDKPEDDGDGKRSGGHGSSPVPAGQQQVGNEDQRDQLDARRYADTDSLPPAPVWLQDVPEHERHENQLDLA